MENSLQCCLFRKLVSLANKVQNAFKQCAMFLSIGNAWQQDLCCSAEDLLLKCNLNKQTHGGASIMENT